MGERRQIHDLRSQRARGCGVPPLGEWKVEPPSRRDVSPNFSRIFHAQFSCAFIKSALPFKDREAEVVEHGFFKRLPGEIRIGDAADGSLDDARVGGAEALEGGIPADLVP